MQLKKSKKCLKWFISKCQVMRDGTIGQSRTYKELSTVGLDFKDLVKAHSDALQKMNTNEDLWEDPQHASIQESHNEFSTSFSNLSLSCESTSYFQHLKTPSSSPIYQDPKITKLVL
jgi:hypothetical protein